MPANNAMILPFVETMITQVCNLACQGCTNYSDLNHQGYVTWSQGKEWLTQWLSRITIQEFGIMGGEPMINPQWRDWCRGVRDLMPGGRIRFTTNGTFLDRTPDILDFFQDLENITLKITVHVPDPLLEARIKSLMDQRVWQKVEEFGISRWAGPGGLRLQINRPQHFLRTFQGEYENMRPWNNQPEQAFAACVQKTCPLLYRGRIYKCSTAGLLLDTLEKFQRPNWHEWTQFIDPGIDWQDHDDAIEEFIANFNRPHSRCAQCPSTADAAIDHSRTVRFKSSKTLVAHVPVDDAPYVI